MQKKEYLLKILTQLEPVRELAPGLKTVIEQGDLGDEVLDTIMDAVESGIQSAKSEIAKEKMEKGLGALQKMKQIEKESKLQDEKELAELDKLLDSF